MRLQTKLLIKSFQITKVDGSAAYLVLKDGKLDNVYYSLRGAKSYLSKVLGIPYKDLQFTTVIEKA